MSLRKIFLILGISPTYLSLLLNGKRPWRGNLKERYLELVNTFVNNPYEIETYKLVPREGVEPTPPCGERILSPPRLPFRHLGLETKHNERAERGAIPLLPPMSVLEATGGLEPPNKAFAELRLNHLATSPSLTILSHLWCRGGDLNSYELTPTAPSRQRVYRFHHLGISILA